MDWVCEACKYENPYLGYAQGIFPSSAGLAFTTELIYYWISEICNNTRSFRSVYMTTNKLHHTLTYNLRYDSGRMSKLGGWQKSNRRVGNDAVRRFIKLIDLDSSSIAGQVYTCSKCEVPIGPSNFKQLGLNPVEHAKTKRIHSVVVDAKVIGLLKDNGPVTDCHDVLTGAPGLNARILSNRPTQNAINMFIRTVRACISKQRNVRAVCVPATAAETGTVGNGDRGRSPAGYIVKDDRFHVRLSEMRRHGQGKKSVSRTKLREYISIVKWFIDKTCCLCPDSIGCEMNYERGNAGMEVRCGTLRRKMQKSEGRNEATYALNSFCTIVTTVSDVAYRGTENGDGSTDEADKVRSDTVHDAVSEGPGNEGEEDKSDEEL